MFVTLVTALSRRVVPYLIGLVTAPIVAAVAKPLVRGTVKGSVAIGLQTKKLAAEAREEFHDIAAEAKADAVADMISKGNSPQR